jgi:hypothetical protein
MSVEAFTTPTVGQPILSTHVGKIAAVNRIAFIPGRQQWLARLAEKFSEPL